MNLRVQPCVISFAGSVGSVKSRFGLKVLNTIVCLSPGEKKSDAESVNLLNCNPKS